MIKKRFLKAIWVVPFFLFALEGLVCAAPSDGRIEKKMLRLIKANDGSLPVNHRVCGAKDRYHIFLVDNFGQNVQVVPEIKTTHGEMIRKMLVSGRPDIRVTALNTSLSKGLARILDHVVQGGCVDAVISSTPGSNYAYEQVATLFSKPEKINENNILIYRDRLKKRIRKIAFDGFFSVQWLQNLKANASKLQDDAVVFVFVETLGKLNIPVFLPYGNRDTTYLGKIKAVNLLSLAENAKVFSALDRQGKRIQGFPYSPLSSGDEPAVYPIMECPHPDDPYKVQIDINDDGYADYAYKRIFPFGDKCRERGTISGTSVIPPNKVKEYLPVKVK